MRVRDRDGEDDKIPVGKRNVTVFSGPLPKARTQCRGVEDFQCQAMTAGLSLATHPLLEGAALAVIDVQWYDLETFLDFAGEDGRAIDSSAEEDKASLCHGIPRDLGRRQEM